MATSEIPRALLIAGPTASGKSALALAYALRTGADIVNADSMQVYADLRVLTARPSREEEASAPHWLFGEVDGAVNFSVGLYEARVREILAAHPGPLVFVGGTGLYFRALIEGLSDIPAVPDAVRAAVRAQAEGRDTAALHADLARLDPEAAARLRPSDRQRVLRALEVKQATGLSLTAFQNRRSTPALGPSQWRGVFLAPDRDLLKRRIAERFDAMLAAGALDEVARLAARGLDPALPVMRAHGAPHLLAHLRGELGLAEAAALGVRDTRAYAKRQFTWARHQLPAFAWMTPEEAAHTLV
jgi:tRNA dimethylallyltransferase